MADRYHKTSPATVFYVYAHEDEPLRDELSKHLSNLARQGLIKEWYDRRIPAGADLTLTISEHFESASLILLLVSPDFLASDYCYSIEMQQALERHHRREACIIPILLRPVDWQGTPFANLQCLPRNEKPVTGWSNRDSAFSDIVRGIREVIENAYVSASHFYSSPLPLIWNIPYPRNPFFTGRDELLAHLASSLKTRRTVALMQPQAISGLGGIGKTQIAIEYAHQHRSLYQAVLWVQSDTRENVVSGYVIVASLLNLPARNEKDQNIIVQAVMRWFEAHADWLLILDNADDLEMIREFIPMAFGGHIILTTRAQAMGRLAHKVEVETMTSDEGTLLLLRRSGFIAQDIHLDNAGLAEQNMARELVLELGGLPLALDQAGAYIEETGCGVIGYLHEYRNHRATLLKRRGGLVNDHPASVATTWSLSFEKIEKANPAAADLLRFCAFLAPDAIPEEIITKGIKHFEPRLQTVVSDQGVLDEALMALRAYSLIRRDVEKKTLSLHRLVQAVLKDMMDTPICQMWTKQAIFAVNDVFPSPDFNVWPQCERYLSNAQICAILIEEQDITLPEAAHLLNNVGRYLDVRGIHIEAQHLLQQALAIRERLLGSDHLDTATSLNNLGNLYHTMGKYAEAEHLLQQALTIREQLLGPDHLVVATSLYNLAQLYHSQGKDSQAEPLLQRALVIREQQQGPEHPSTSTILNIIGILYRLQRKYVEAEDLLQRALAIREQQLEPNNPLIADSLNHLAFLYIHQERYIEAKQLLQRALIIQEKELGSEHKALMSTLNNLGNIYAAQGRYVEAEALLQRTVNTREQQLGANHPVTLMSLRSLASLYMKQERYLDAEPLYKKVLAIREQQLGSNHPDTLSVAKEYALFLRKTYRYVDAEQIELHFPLLNLHH